MATAAAAVRHRSRCRFLFFSIGLCFHGFQPFSFFGGVVVGGVVGPLFDSASGLRGGSDLSGVSDLFWRRRFGFWGTSAFGLFDGSLGCPLRFSLVPAGLALLLVLGLSVSALFWFDDGRLSVRLVGYSGFTAPLLRWLGLIFLRVGGGCLFFFFFFSSSSSFVRVVRNNGGSGGFFIQLARNTALFFLVGLERYLSLSVGLTGGGGGDR